MFPEDGSVFNKNEGECGTLAVSECQRKGALGESILAEKCLQTLSCGVLVSLKQISLSKKAT